MSLKSVYRFEMALLGPCRAMTARGIRVDDSLRLSRIAALGGAADELTAKAEPLVAALRPKLKRADLLWKRKVCKACRNGKKKRLSCTSCGSAGQTEIFGLKLGSGTQLKDILYSALKLPRRTQGGKETTDEEALQSLLALDKTGLVAIALRYAKLATMREIYERLAPASDGRVRTVFNPAGTYTGRFSASGAFYVSNSTNLQNLPASEAARDELYRVRECLTPAVGRVFLYADLSQAEARVVACLAEDDYLLEAWQDPKWDAHKWTASRIFGKAEQEISGAERFLGKRSRHALNYGLGVNKFWRYVNADADLTGVAITLKEAKVICEGYHALHPNLDGVWWNRVQRQLEQERPLANCFGRTCNFYPRFDPFTGQLDAETLRAAIAWEPQSTVSHLAKLGLLQLYENERSNGHAVLFEGHDSVLLEVDQHRVRSAVRLAKQALEREIVVNERKLTIPSEIFVGRHSWQELERVA
jgi:DNA polymerase I